MSVIKRPLLTEKTIYWQAKTFMFLKWTDRPKKQRLKIM